jgi:hypothetical protein
MNTLRKLCFFWLVSFSLAFLVYWILWLFQGHVYGAFYRMFCYHYEHPVQYMLIPCFFFGIFATIHLKRFAASKATAARIAITAWIILLTVLVSSPIGGMLWELHDMLAGYFPPAALSKIITQGTAWGLKYGWAILLSSTPYNIIGCILCYFILKAGARRFAKQQ